MFSLFKHFLAPYREPNCNKKKALPPALKAIIPENFYLPLRSERGQFLYPKIARHQRVTKGEIIADTEEQTAPLHSPVTGEISDIIQHPSSFSSNQTVETLVLQPAQGKEGIVDDANPLWVCDKKIQSAQRQTFTKQEIKTWHDKLEKSGIVGMGGAGFSSIEKIKISYRKGVHTVLLNLCECEPIISCDEGLTQQHTQEILLGAIVLINCIQAQQAIIVIDDDKILALQKLQALIAHYPLLSLHTLPSAYPSGHENQLVQYVSGKKLTKNKRPMDEGYVVFNVATCYAIYRACYYGEPLTQRLLTISDGDKRINQWALIGTPIIDLLQQHNIDYDPNKHNLIMGGPMNGLFLSDPRIGVSKNLNCLLVLPRTTEQLGAPSSSHFPCIRCGECVDVCPANLLPQQLYWFAQAKQHQKAEEYHLFDCIECGNCAFVCPSKIPLVQYYRLQKQQINEKKLEQYQTQKAKERYDKRNLRLEKAKQKHQQMLQQKRLQAQQKLLEKQRESSSEQRGENRTSQAIAVARTKALAKQQQKAQKNTP